MITVTGIKPFGETSYNGRVTLRVTAVSP